MKSQCPHCGAQLDSESAAQNQDQSRCWMCTAPIVLKDLPKDLTSETMIIKPLAPRDRSAQGRVGDSFDPATTTLVLPGNRHISLSVTEGPSEGLEYTLTRPLVTIGRSGGTADIQVNDSQVSRLHCSIEVKRDTILLNDLRSTNGTYVAEKRVRAAHLKHDSEFRVGSSFFRIAISPKP
jgi:Inner membrane component of T3SS, cytoplasmic domain